MSEFKRRWQLQLYRALTWLAQPLLRRKLARRALAEPGYAQAVPERFGFYTQPEPSGSALVWVHAVSLGETRTAAILLKRWREQQPGLRILLTHGTATGRAEGQDLLRDGDIQVWQPWDSRVAVERFLGHFKPSLGVLLETEVWPNLMAVARQRALPVVLINARMSVKSLSQALRLPALALPAYGALAAVYAQTEADAQRLRQLGAPLATVSGNLKFDATPDPLQQTQAARWRESLPWPVLMLASSREGEEAQFLDQLQRLPPSDIRRFQPLIVPRHPQRFDEVQRLIEARGFRVSRRSSWQLGPPNAAALSADVWLGDSLGEMALYYSLSRVALLGGSFAPLGGQNLIEPAACGCPVVMGPHTFNFSQAAEQAQSEGAAVRVHDLAAALDSAGQLLERDQEHLAMAAAGLGFAARHRGAADQTVAGLMRWSQGRG
jgi:3-deoxy-D-manno-octulosonic-acid transferase